MLARQKIGYWIALGGGFVALFAYFVLPYVTLIVSATVNRSVDTQTASLNGSQLGSSHWPFWLLPVMAAMAVAVAGLQLYKEGASASERRYGYVLAALGALSILAQFVLMSILNSDSSQLVDAYKKLFGATLSISVTFGFAIGFWVQLLSKVVVFAGGIITVYAQATKFSEQPSEPAASPAQWPAMQQQLPQPVASGLQWSTGQEAFPPAQGSQFRRWPPQPPASSQ